MPAQGALDALTCVLLLTLVLRLTQSARAAYAAGGLHTLNPTAWHFADTLLTEIPLALVITALALIFLRLMDSTASRDPSLRRSLALGLLCGLAALVRLNMLLLLVAVVVFLQIGRDLAWRSWLERAGVILLSSALVISP